MSTSLTEARLPADHAGAPGGLRPEWVTGWGGGARSEVRRFSPPDRQGLAAWLRDLDSPTAGVIARGLGRAYGDAAQRTGGVVVDTRRLDGIELDPGSGVATVGAGVSLRQLLAEAIPSGWIVPVVPGTQHVSVGGAIASDIHGKNHGTVGTFGRHVEALGLVTSAGELRECAPGMPDRLFEATVGGMGLTGVIVWARIALRRVSGSALSVDTDRVADLDGALDALSQPGGEHRVAWLDLLSPRGPRGVVTRAAHLNGGELSPPQVTRSTRASVPSWWREGLLRPATVRAFNDLRYRLAPRRQRGHPEAFAAHMFPLDGLDAWPRLYGRHGFLQYQFVVPRGHEQVLAGVLERLRRAAVPCYLAVLKDFGPAGEGLLSFPIEGWTLALDLPRAAPGIEQALAACDELVAGAGGRVYLSKDARMRPEAIRTMYPRLAEWQAVRERVDPNTLWRSDLAVRTGLVPG